MSPFNNQSVFEKAGFLHQNDGLATRREIIRWRRSAKFLLKLKDYDHIKNKNPQKTFFDMKIFTITAAVESLNLPNIKA